MLTFTEKHIRCVIRCVINANPVSPENAQRGIAFLKRNIIAKKQNTIRAWRGAQL